MSRSLPSAEAGAWSRYAEGRLLSRNRLLYPRHRLVTEQFVDFFSDVDTGRRVLDVGCAEGYFLGLLREMGFSRLEGIDPSLPFVRKARAKGLDVRVGSAADLPPCGSYDVVLLMDVLEHLAEPAAALRKVRGALRHGGTLLLTVPVCDSIQLRCRRLFGGVPKLAQLQSWDETHLSAYSAGTLRGLLADCGFAVALMRHVYNPFPAVGRLCRAWGNALCRLSFGGALGDFCFVAAIRRAGR